MGPFIGAQLRLDLHLALISFLKHYHDCFAWTHKDMTGISLDVMVHKLQVNLDHPLVK